MHIAFFVVDSAFTDTVVRLSTAEVRASKSSSDEGESFDFINSNRHNLELYDGDVPSLLGADT